MQSNRILSDAKLHPLTLVNLDQDGAWNELLKLAPVFLTNEGLERLRSILGPTAKTVALEFHYIDKDYRDTFYNYHSKRFNTPPSRCLRLHFFNRQVSAEDLFDRARVQPGYIGYSVIRPTRPNCIGRTLLDPAHLAHPAGTMCLCHEEVSIQGCVLHVQGFPFISQDTDASACAQSALWMLLRFFSNRYKTYREIYPTQIGHLTKDYSIGRLMPTQGLADFQMAEATRQLGFSPVSYTRRNYGALFEPLLYTYVESGIPVLASFSGSHAVVVTGHRSDYTRTLDLTPEQNYVFTWCFNDAFVINDDNAVPYQLLSGDGLPPVDGPTLSSSLSTSKIETFIAPLPEKVFLLAEEFKEIAVALLLGNGPFAIPKCSRLLDAPGARPLVFRMFLTTGRAYKKHLRERGMGSPLAENVYRGLPLPHFIWICEITTQAAFANHQVLGEVVWDATRNSNEADGWIALHYPEAIFFDLGSALNGPRDVKRIDLPEFLPYPVYRHNLHEVRL